MLKISSKNWLEIYLIVQLSIFILIMTAVIYIDPYFRYHKPLNNLFYYGLNSERNQNNGITRKFDYDMLITGTSMAQNFKTSEADRIFQAHSIKVPYSGASYKEINDNVKVGIEGNPKLKTVIRCLDMGAFGTDKDYMRSDMGTYPTYLYNDNPFDDVKYFYNKGAILRCGWMILGLFRGEAPGITSFDEYSNWMSACMEQFGRDNVLKGHSLYKQPIKEDILSNEEKDTIKANIGQNVTQIAKEHPEVQFYYFFSPYSAAWWGDTYQAGDLSKQIEMERYVIELILECDNIHLFSFNNFTDITINLDNYVDRTHYGEWINSAILQYMYDGEGELTKDNYKEYLEEEYRFYSEFDYNGLF